MLWLLWNTMLIYIALQDLRYHCFPVWSVFSLSGLTLWICPYCVGDILWCGGLLSFLKYLIEWKRTTSYLGWGDVEVLALLSSQSSSIPGFFMVSGILGAVSCALFNRNGIPFVPIMTMAWYGVEGWNKLALF
ncbi:hypothetical protein HCUR_01308 [Holospora curviuscula]|uniref:Type IV leader peptidase family protein n=2 Tax=Holospora curviuscula TaxID=1082868 RepID=A0A2S5R7C6_9PROT|nr:hypothetical protein HCUR_01308 [Holospora curviuscula]